MQNKPHLQLMTIGAARAARALIALPCLALLTLATAVHAGQPGSGATLSVSPAIGVVGNERRIVISGEWSDACPPSTAAVSVDSETAPTALTVRLIEPATFAPCAQVITPYTVEAKYTPRLPGTLRVVATVRLDTTLADGRMVTVSTDNAGAAVDVSGLWLEAAPSSSVLIIRQSNSNPDALVGTWSVFGKDGNSRALLFHSSVRTVKANVYQAPLYSMSAQAAASCPDYGCPVTGFTTTQVGWVRIEVRSTNRLVVEAWMHGFPNDVLAFRSELQRIAF